MKKIVDKIFNRVLAPIQEKRYLETFFAETKGVKKEGQGTKGRILMYVGIGHMYLTPLEILMYHILIDEGYEVDYLIYDEMVKANEVITKSVIETQGKDKFWKNSLRNAHRVLKASNVAYKNISKDARVDSLLVSVKGDLDEILSFKYENIDFGDIVRGVLYRYYKSLKFGDDCAEVAFNFLETALTNYLMVDRLYRKANYKAVFFSHGIYCTWEPVVAYCRNNDLRFVCYDRAKMAGSCNFNINQPSPDWSFNLAWNTYKDRALTNEEELLVTQYLGERELQKGDVYAYNDSKKVDDIQALKKELGIPNNRKLVTIFTNLIWDAANVSRDIAFESPLNCIKKTIDYYKGRNDVQIVIRSHPAEKVLGTSERYGTLVRDMFGNSLPENVTIIEPEMSVNSFSVIEMSDIGVVNTSTVGLEFALLGKPIILISETNYRGKGFTYDANSGEEYFRFIDDLLSSPDLLPNQVEKARRYFFMMMFLYQKKMPVVYHGGLFQNYLYKSFKARDRNDALHQVISGFEDSNRRDFIFWN
jgi:hypothetical protein